MTWISVNERLPEENVCVIGWSPKGNTVYWCWNYGGVLTAPCLQDHVGPFTHWMPLPEPPEETIKFKRLLYGAITEHEGFPCDVGLPEGHTAAVFMRDESLWNVVHIQSGLGMGTSCDTREGAIEKARANWKAHPLSLEKLDRYAREFQERLNAEAGHAVD